MKLSQGELVEIKELYDGSYGSVRELAKLFKVNPTVIRRHTNHRGYKDWLRQWQKKKRQEPKYKEINRKAQAKYRSNPKNRLLVKKRYKEYYKKHKNKIRKQQKEYYKKIKERIKKNYEIYKNKTLCTRSRY